MSFFTKLLGGSPETYADKAEQGTKLLSGKWSLCAHKGFWYGATATVSDNTGVYLRQVGDCKSCKKQVERISSLDHV